MSSVWWQSPLRFCALMLAAACTALPASGPSARAIQDVANTTDSFAVVLLNPGNIGVFGPAQQHRINHRLVSGQRPLPARQIDVGDQLLVSIWEPSPDGLFATSDTKSAQIEVVVDQSKSIFVPYAGRISVENLDAEGLRSKISDLLIGRAIDPQVQVTLANQESQRVSVIGDVAAPGQFQVPPNGLRLIEVIARAGGARASSFETDVSIVRGTVQDTLQMDAILGDHRNNIWLQPRDTIKLTHRPRSFTAFGAVTAQKLQPLGTETVSLAEAIAQSGGLNDMRADTGAVFLFRYTARTVLVSAGVTLPKGQDEKTIPTVFQVDFADPNAFFLTSAFAMRDDDIIYVANAAGTELQKLTNLIIAPFFGNAEAVNALTN